MKNYTKRLSFESLSQFEIIEGKNGKLGVGSFASVTLGVFKPNNKKYAIKTVRSKD